MPSYEIIAPLRSVMRIEIESEKELNRSEVYAAVTREDLDVFTETDWDDVTTSWDQSTEEELIIYEEDSAKELTRDDGKNIFRKATEKHLQKVISENVLTEELGDFLDSNSLITEDGEEKEFSPSDFKWEVSVNLQYVGG